MYGFCTPKNAIAQKAKCRIVGMHKQNVKKWQKYAKNKGYKFVTICYF